MSLSKLMNKTFTIINRIPASANNAQITAYKKYLLIGCGVQGGFIDKSSGTMVYKSNVWTAWISDWRHYKPPTWTDSGYYGMSSKDGFYTASNGDLLIFADISDAAPETSQEFQTLVNKYKDMGGLITAANPYINYNATGMPWKTNHIELIKG